MPPARSPRALQLGAEAGLSEVEQAREMSVAERQAAVRLAAPAQSRIPQAARQTQNYNGETGTEIQSCG